MNNKLKEYNMISKGNNIKLNLMVLIVQIIVITKKIEIILINKWQTNKKSLTLKQIYLMNKILLIMLSIN